MRSETRTWRLCCGASLAVHASVMVALGLARAHSAPRMALPSSEASGIRVRLMATRQPVPDQDERDAPVEIDSAMAREPEIQERPSDALPALAQLATLPARLESVETAWRNWVANTIGGAAQLRRDAHRLAGRAEDLFAASLTEAERLVAPDQPAPANARRMVSPHQFELLGPAPAVLTEAQNSPEAGATPAAPGVTRSPTPLADNPPPLYPQDALQKRQAGALLLRLVVEADGAVSSVALVKSSGVASLDAAARTTALRWRFAPALEGGEPIRCEIIVPIEFVLR